MYLPPRLIRYSIRFFNNNKSVYYNRSIGQFINNDEEAREYLETYTRSKVTWDTFICKAHDEGIDEFQAYLDSH